MSAPPSVRVPLSVQRDVLHEITHGWVLRGYPPKPQQVAPLERAELVLDRREIDALIAAHWVIARLADLPDDSVRRFIMTGGRK